MYWLEPAKPEPLPAGGLSRLTMSLLIAAIFFFGVYPQPILNAIDQPAERATSPSLVRHQSSGTFGMLHLLHQFFHPTHCYALCAVARSGAHLLLRDCRRPIIAGRPLQYFHDHLAPKYAARYGFDATRLFLAYLRGIMTASATRNGVFGVRILKPGTWNAGLGQLRESGEFGGARARETELLRAAFPRLRCIQLTREDKLRQAISKARAMQTDFGWASSTMPLAGSPSSTRSDHVVSRSAAQRSEETWRDFFQRNRFTLSPSLTKTCVPIIRGPVRAPSIFFGFGRRADLSSGHPRRFGRPMRDRGMAGALLPAGGEEKRNALGPGDSVAQLDVPVGEIDKMPPALVRLAAEGNVDERSPLRPLRSCESNVMCASCGRRLPLRVLHGMQEQTTFSHVVRPPLSRGST